MTNANNRRRRRRRCLGFLSLLAVGLLPDGAQAGEDFVAGSGRARASIFEIVPRTGGLTIPVSFGRASASYPGRRAEASSVAGRFPVDSPFPAAGCGDRSPGGGRGGGGGGSSPPNPTENPAVVRRSWPGDRLARVMVAVNPEPFGDSVPRVFEEAS